MRRPVPRLVGFLALLVSLCVIGLTVWFVTSTSHVRQTPAPAFTAQQLPTT